MNRSTLAVRLLSVAVLLGASFEGAAQDEPSVTIFCQCSDGQVCGTNTPGDPFRCCNAAQDTCSASSYFNPCKPLRCATAPTCCDLIFAACMSDADCGGSVGSCDLAVGLCTAPCEPSVNGGCSSASRTCVLAAPAVSQVPDGTPCDDKRACSAAVPPPPSPVACGSAIGGVTCARDRAPSDAVDNTGDCPTTAPVCSGSGSALGGQGGAIVGGRCCPRGTACNLATNTCISNLGTAVNANDVCRAGTCSSDTFVGCAPSSGEAVNLTASRDAAAPLLFVDVTWTNACNATNHVVYWGTSPIVSAPNWTGASCALGTTGIGMFNSGTVQPGTFQYFVVVGRMASSQGSYGKASSGLERPDAVDVGACDLPMVLYPCP